MEMKANHSSVSWILIIQSLAVISVSQGPEFFQLIQQWPGSQQNVCYPTTGKPAQSFTIGGFWPKFNISVPTYCEPDSHFNVTEVSELIDYLQKDWPSLACPSSNGTQLWAEEWEKHGTCSLSVFDQYNYFNHAIGLKEILGDQLVFLEDKGIRPNGTAYNLNTIKNCLRDSFGQKVGIECNEDASGNCQLYRIHICIDRSGTYVIDCPVPLDNTCADSVVFPSF